MCAHFLCILTCKDTLWGAACCRPVKSRPSNRTGGKGHCPSLPCGHLSFVAVSCTKCAICIYLFPVTDIQGVLLSNCHCHYMFHPNGMCVNCRDCLYEGLTSKNSDMNEYHIQHGCNLCFEGSNSVDIYLHRCSCWLSVIHNYTHVQFWYYIILCGSLTVECQLSSAQAEVYG